MFYMTVPLLVGFALTQKMSTIGWVASILVNLVNSSIF